MPTTCEGRAGFSDLIFSSVFTRRPPITMSYSRPSSAPTLVSASRMRRAFSGLLKSVGGSLRNGLVGSSRAGLAVSSVVVAIRVLRVDDDVNEPFYFTAPSGHAKDTRDRLLLE